MVTPFQDMLRGGVPLEQATAGETLIYTRGSYTVSVTGLRNTMGLQAPDVQGVYGRDGRMEFRILATVLKLNSVAVEPARGDTITDAAGVIYDVQADWDYDRESLEYAIPVREVDG